MLIFPVQAGVSCMWTNDSQRLLLEHFDTIHDSPSQLYHSALPFSPSSSWFHECYSLELSQDVKVVKGLSAEWGMCSRTALLSSCPYSLSYWNNTIAVGSERDILTLDAITGSQTAVLSGHTDIVRSVTFSSNGTSLVSGSEDKTVKLWDVQTGGIVRTFYGHTDHVLCVSISVDHTTIASGSLDKTLCLWDIGKGECHQIIEHQEKVDCVRFSTTNPQCLISLSGRTIQQWDIDGHKVGPTYDGYHITFFPDGTQFILGPRGGVTIDNTNPGLIVAKFHQPDKYDVLCLSPDYKLVAISAGWNIHVWDITGSQPHLVETFIGHAWSVLSLAFSSSSTLISAAGDHSVKFWQIGASSIGTTVTDPKSASLTLAPTKSTALKSKNELIIPSDLPDGVVWTWGILTGLHKGSLQISAEDSHQNNTQLTDNKLIFVWHADEKINIWDVEKGGLLQTINVPGGTVEDLKVSGDGSKVFCMYGELIQAWDIQTGEAVNKLRAQDVDIETGDGMVACERMVFDRMEGSKVWVHVIGPRYIGGEGWDFGIPGSPPVLVPRISPRRLHLNDNKVWEIKMSRMEDVVTGKVIVKLPRRFGEAIHVQWGGHYLVILFKSKEVVILDFSNVSL